MTHWISVLVCISQNRRIKYSPRILLKCFIPHFLKEKSMISLEVTRHVWLLEENIIRYICLFYEVTKRYESDNRNHYLNFSHIFFRARTHLTETIRDIKRQNWWKKLQGQWFFFCKITSKITQQYSMVIFLEIIQVMLSLTCYYIQFCSDTTTLIR